VTRADPLFLAIDVGTTGARAAVIDLDGGRVAEIRRPYATTSPRPGWAEQDPDEWGDQALSAVRGIPKAIAGRIAAIGLTGQSPSVAPVDRHGRALGPGLIYKDNRAVEEAAIMIDRLGARAIHDRTGHTPTAFHVGTKVLWLHEHQPEIFEATHLFLQPRDVVLHRLVNEMATDESHANATLFYDLRARSWAEDLFVEFNLDPRRFPQALPSWTKVAELSPSQASSIGLPSDIPVVIGAGDSQCVAFGVGVVDKGAISEMAGSSSCLNSVVTVPRRDLRITHYNHVVPNCFTTEVGLNTTGAALSWAVEQLGFSSFEHFIAAAESFHESLEIPMPFADARAAAPLFLPYLGDGERDDPAMRAGFVGLSDRHDRSALAYAVVEGVAFATTEMVEILRRAGSPLEELRVSGGAARVDLLGQIKSNLLNRPVAHLSSDASASGAALLGAQAAGFVDVRERATRELLNEATWFTPDEHMSELLDARRTWFRRVRQSAALHLPRSTPAHEELP
jgi:sugar (pentulose or hexulose) kinase